VQKKILRIFAVILIFAGLLQQSAPAHWGVSSYYDYTPPSWVQEAVIHLQYYSITRNEYVSDADITDMHGFKCDIRRDAIAFILVNLYEHQTGAELSTPEDYPLRKWQFDGFEESVKKAYGIGLMQGRSATDFGYESLTRQELAVVMYRAARIMGCFNGDASGYQPLDADEIAPWAKDAVSYVYHEGILIGTSDDTFSPKDFVTRDMAYVAIHRFAIASGIYDQLPAEYIDSFEFIKPHTAGDVDRLCAAVSADEAQVIRVALELFHNAFEVHAYTADMERSPCKYNDIFGYEPDTSRGEYGRLIIRAEEGNFSLILTEIGIFWQMTISNGDYSKYEDLIYKIIEVSRYTDIYMERFEYVRQQAKEMDDKRYYEAESCVTSDKVAYNTWAYITVAYDVLYDVIIIEISEIYYG